MRACPRCLTVYETDPEFCAFDGERLFDAVEAHALQGRELEGFVLGERIGVGGTGTVYRGTVAETGTPCAIKLLFGEMATDRHLVARFRREAEVVSQIDHPNIVSILRCGVSPSGLTFLAMEYVDGRTMKDVLEQEAPMEAKRVARLADQLSGGLAAAHRQGYVHRDLKPSNVILTGAPPHETVKILDFGIVACLHEQQADSRLTRSGFIVGTPTYMAPEQVDPKSVSPQVDVYALGVMLYEMLSGHAPFSGTLEQILVAKMTLTPDPISGSGAFGDFVLKMLAPHPNDRPPSALHVSAELSRMSLLTDDPITERSNLPNLSDIDNERLTPSVVEFLELGSAEPGHPDGGSENWQADTFHDANFMELPTPLPTEGPGVNPADILTPSASATDDMDPSTLPTGDDEPDALLVTPTRMELLQRSQAPQPSQHLNPTGPKTDLMMLPVDPFDMPDPPSGSESLGLGTAPIPTLADTPRPEDPDALDDRGGSGRSKLGDTADAELQFPASDPPKRNMERLVSTVNAPPPEPTPAPVQANSMSIRLVRPVTEPEEPTSETDFADTIEREPPSNWDRGRTSSIRPPQEPSAPSPTLGLPPVLPPPLPSSGTPVLSASGGAAASAIPPSVLEPAPQTIPGLPWIIGIGVSVLLLVLAVLVVSWTSQPEPIIIDSSTPSKVKSS